MGCIICIILILTWLGCTMYRGHPSIGREVSEGVDQSHEDHPSLRTAILIGSRGCSHGNLGGTPELQGLQYMMWSTFQHIPTSWLWITWYSHIASHSHNQPDPTRLMDPTCDFFAPGLTPCLHTFMLRCFLWQTKKKKCKGQPHFFADDDCWMHFLAQNDIDEIDEQWRMNRRWSNLRAPKYG